MKGDRLPGESASKLGHLEVLKSELVKKFVEQFEANGPGDGSRLVTMGKYSTRRETPDIGIWSRRLDASNRI